MKNKLLTIVALLCCNILSHAQINYNTYGDGSLRLLSDRYKEWSTQTFEWDDIDSVSYSYNVQGLESETRKFKSPANVWDYFFRGTKTYTASGKPLFFVDSNFTAPSGCKQTEYTYNANDQETLLTRYRISNGNWVLEARAQTNYTAFDSVNVYLTQEFISNVWENTSRNVFVYNPQNRDTLSTYEIWNNNQWNGYSRVIFTYNSNGLVATLVNQQYDTNSGSYKNYTQIVYTYDVNNRLSIYTQKFWDQFGNSWVNSGKSTYTYNANGNFEQVLTEEWNSQNLEWDLYSLSTYTYDANNRRTSFLFQSRNGSSWENRARRTFTYNTQSYMTNDLEESWDANTLAWTNFSEWAYYYETNPLYTKISEKETTKLFVFPNPSNSPVTFVNADKNMPYVVYDMQGKIITQGNLQPGTNSIILNEAKGNYILKAGNSSTVLVKQ